MSDDRRRDTREKIALGGLVVKAGLRQADRAFILGALLSAARLKPNDPRWRELRALGGAAFGDATPATDEGEPPEATPPLLS